MIDEYIRGMNILEELTEKCPEHGDYKRYRTERAVLGWCKPCRARDEDKRMAEARARERAELVRHLQSISRIPRRFAGKRFEHYLPTTPKQTKARAACQSYIADLGARIASGACVVLVGPPGVGKTHLLAALASAAIEHGIFARYATMMDVLAAVKGSWAWHGAEHGEAFIKPALLMLDEVWTPQSGRDRESVLALLDERYRLGLVTHVASNLSWPQMQEELGLRFCDRLLEGGGQVLSLDGKSQRK
jgi:DNA replication protein DnaC